MEAIQAGAEEHALLLIRLVCAFWLSALVAPVGAAFELGGGGAYTTSLGGAFSAGVESAEAVWFNPAAAARLRTARMTSTHGTIFTSLPESPSVHSASAAWPASWGTAQVGYSTLRADSWNESSLLLGLARVVHPRLALGAQLGTNGWESGKFARRHWLGNIGGLYEAGWLTSKSYVRMSFVLANLGSGRVSANERSTGQRDRSYTLGMQVVSAERTLLFDAELQEGDWQFRAGYEAKVRDLLKMRFGARVYSGDTVNRTWHAGMGYEWKKVHFDYAFSHSIDLSTFGATHRFGVGYFWN
ncbi:MAG: hypothetical protein ACI906_002867 [Candidatus Latescibacterota bacterium]